MPLNLSIHMDYLEGDFLAADRSIVMYQKFDFSHQLGILEKILNSVYSGLAL